MNPGKILLIAGIVLGIAAGGMGAYTMSSAKVNKLNTKVDNSAPADIAALTEKVDQVNKALAQNFTIVDVAPEGAVVNGKPRFTPLFYAPELWQVTIDQKNVVMDIYDPQSPTIHGDVPNSWFIENGLQEVMGRADALTLDSDGDVFTNAEEHAAGTKPTDNKSFPALINVKSAKLEVTEVLRDKFVVQIDGGLAFDDAAESAGVKVFRKLGDPEPETKKTVKKDETFGPKGDEGRFTVLGFERQTFHDGSGSDVTETVIKVRDNKTVSAQKEFTIRSGTVRPGANKKDSAANEKGLRINDSSVVMRVTAGPKAGTTFTVAEKGTFKVPGAENLNCTLESIDEAGSANILLEGLESSVNIPYKGSKPARAERGEKNAKTAADDAPKSPEKQPKKGKKDKK